jgi:hypothetical protein
VLNEFNNKFGMSLMCLKRSTLNIVNIFHPQKIYNYLIETTFFSRKMTLRYSKNEKQYPKFKMRSN